MCECVYVSVCVYECACVCEWVCECVNKDCFFYDSMLHIPSVMGCRLTFDKLLRGGLLGGLWSKLMWGGAGQVTMGRGGLWATMWARLLVADQGGLRPEL